MLKPDDALAEILDSCEPLPAQLLPLRKAAGAVLAEDIVAREDSPRFTNSAMDGFAVQAADLEGASKNAPGELKVREPIRAGQAAGAPLEQGQAIPIMTGAPVPPGADAVVMKEHAARRNGLVRINKAPALGENIRPAGEDVKAGEPILSRGASIRPYEVALLASQGFARVMIVRRPRVAILATGDELAEGEPGPAQIRNSNGPALAAAIRRWGAEAIEVPPVPDEPSALKTAFLQARDSADVLLITGGVSVGDYDYTQPVLREAGAEIRFWKTSIKPGKPLLFAVWPRPKASAPEEPEALRRNAVLVFGLPGNPISALVCTEEFVRPALEKLQGRRGAPPSYHLSGRTENAYPLKSARRHYLFCEARKIEGGFTLHILRPQGSARVGMPVRANALARAEGGPRRVEAGEELPFRWIK